MTSYLVTQVIMVTEHGKPMSQMRKKELKVLAVSAVRRSELGVYWRCYSRILFVGIFFCVASVGFYPSLR